MNVTILQGCLSRPPELRTLPSGDALVAYEVTVAPTADRKAESVPVVWFEAPPAAAAIEAEAEVVVVGRVRRRFFRAGGSTQSRTEVVADQVIPARQVKKAGRLVLDALAEVEAAIGAP